jgi:hypothetical protein
MATKYESYVARGKAAWGRKFTTKELAKKFVPAFNSGARIRVKFSTGEVLSGTVGATTGWRPAFLLVLSRRSLGSSWTLKNRDRIVPNTTPIKRY